MSTSKFVEISKRIGWNYRAVPIPSIEMVFELKRKVLAEKCEASYEEVMRIKRFSRNPINDSERTVMKVINETWFEGKKLFT